MLENNQPLGKPEEIIQQLYRENAELKTTVGDLTLRNNRQINMLQEQQQLMEAVQVVLASAVADADDLSFEFLPDPDEG